MGLDYEIVKISECNEMIKFGRMMTPALAIDVTSKAVGKVPTVKEIKAMID